MNLRPVLPRLPFLAIALTLVGAPLWSRASEPTPQPSLSPAPSPTFPQIIETVADITGEGLRGYEPVTNIDLSEMLKKAEALGLTRGRSEAEKSELVAASLILSKILDQQVARLGINIRPELSLNRVNYFTRIIMIEAVLQDRLAALPEADRTPELEKKLSDDLSQQGPEALFLLLKQSKRDVLRSQVMWGACPTGLTSLCSLLQSEVAEQGVSWPILPIKLKFSQIPADYVTFRAYLIDFLKAQMKAQLAQAYRKVARSRAMQAWIAQSGYHFPSVSPREMESYYQAIRNDVFVVQPAVGKIVEVKISGEKSFDYLRRLRNILDERTRARPELVQSLKGTDLGAVISERNAAYAEVPAQLKLEFAAAIQAGQLVVSTQEVSLESDGRKAPVHDGVPASILGQLLNEKMMTVALYPTVGLPMGDGSIRTLLLVDQKLGEKSYRSFSEPEVQKALEQVVKSRGNSYIIREIIYQTMERNRLTPQEGQGSFFAGARLNTPGTAMALTQALSSETLMSGALLPGGATSTVHHSEWLNLVQQIHLDALDLVIDAVL